MLATLPGRTQGLGLITEPMLRDLQLDRVTYATINLWATLLGARDLPADRPGVRSRRPARATTFALTLLLGAVVWTMSRLAGGVAGAVPAGARHPRARTERAVGGQHHRGRQVVRPQRRRRDGRLLGPADRVLRGGVHGGRAASVRVDGWRTAWAQVAFGLFAPRGAGRAAAPRAARAARAPNADEAMPASAACRWPQALRTPAFWVFGGATSLFGLVSSGLGLFNEAVLAERGFSQQTYVQVPRRHVDRRAGRAAGVRLADAALADAAPARHRDVPLRRGAGARCRSDDANRSCGSSPR